MMRVFALTLTMGLALGLSGPASAGGATLPASVRAASTLAAPAPAVAGATLTNPIVLENAKRGSTGWRIPWSGKTVASDSGGQVKGYFSATSIAAGQSIALKVSTNPAQQVGWQLYRLGWYGGAGGRLVTSGTATGVRQPACPMSSSTGLRECSWSTAATIATTASWTSGVYVAVLTAGAYQNYAFFTLRDDRAAALLSVSPVDTYEAYNNYPSGSGKSLYGYNSAGANTVGGTPAAVKVSFDRPYMGSGAGLLFTDEMPWIQYVESRGFDVTYATDVDAHLTPAELAHHAMVVLPGHSEYWTKQMYDGIVASRDAGVSLANLGANTIYWSTRVEPSSAGVAGRVVVCYRDATIDPGTDKTTTWRNLGRPEQAVLGAMYAGPGGLVAGRSPLKAAAPNHWALRGTALQAGSTIPGIIAIEADRRQPGFPLPTGTDYSVLAQSPLTDRYGGSSVAETVIHKAPSGAWVFNASTLGWTQGLTGGPYRDARMDLMTTNVLARMSHFASSASTARFGGVDRYETAVLASQGTFAPGVPTVHLATGADFPDALAASAATHGQGPVLLVRKDSIPDVVAAELARLQPAVVHIAGGPSVVSAEVEEAVVALTGASVVRDAGSDRYVTAARVSSASFAPQVPVAYVATGSTFPDALAAGATGALLGGPVLLTAPGRLPDATRAELARLRPAQIVIVGGSGAVGSAVETAAGTIAPTIRLGGSDRYATARELTHHAVAAGAAGAVALAIGTDYPDALAAGPVAANRGGIVVLTGTILAPSTAEEIVRADPDQVLFLGAEPVLPASVAAGVSRLFDVVDGVPTATRTDATAQPFVERRSLTEHPTEADPSYPGRELSLPDQLPWLDR